MKRIRLLILLGVVAVALPFGLSRAGATTTSTGTTDVTLSTTAQYDFVGTIIHVGFKARCTGGTGQIVVTVKQYPPETPEPMGAGGFFNNVACDGQTHTGGVTVSGMGFDPGKAWAEATLTSPGGSDTDARWIDIRVMNGT
jgi:hypothetical protein